jgi:hypothetical protein
MMKNRAGPRGGCTMIGGSGCISVMLIGVFVVAIMAWTLA